MKHVAFPALFRQPAAWLLLGVLLSWQPVRLYALGALAANGYGADELRLGEGVLGASRQDPAPVRLVVGQAVKSTVANNETQTFTFPLAAGQVAHVAVEQQDVDVVITARAPNGKKLAEVDSPNGSKGFEMVWLQATKAGEYRVAVRTLEKNTTGAYQITLEAARAATPADAQRLRAQQLMVEGQTQRATLNARSSAAERQAVVQQFAAARAIWQDLKESREANLALLSLRRTDPTAALVAAQLPSSTNKMTVYYSPGNEARALAMRTNVEEALAFLQANFPLSPTISLAVLNEADWALVGGNSPYGPFSLPGLIVLPGNDFDAFASSMLRSSLTAAQLQAAEADGLPLEKQVQFYFEDVVYHELGHLYSSAYGIRFPNHWTDEVMASYLMFNYLGDKHPERAKNVLAVGNLFLQAVRPAHTSLDDFDRLYMGGISPMNYGWYQAQFALRAEALYQKEKLALVDKMKKAFPVRSSPRRAPADVLARMEQLSSGFVAWSQQLTSAAATK